MPRHGFQPDWHTGISGLGNQPDKNYAGHRQGTVLSTISCTGGALIRVPTILGTTGILGITGYNYPGLGVETMGAVSAAAPTIFSQWVQTEFTCLQRILFLLLFGQLSCRYRQQYTSNKYCICMELSSVFIYRQ